MMRAGDRVQGTWPVCRVGPSGRVVSRCTVSAVGTVVAVDAGRGVALVSFRGARVELATASLTVVEAIRPPTLSPRQQGRPTALEAPPAPPTAPRLVDVFGSRGAGGAAATLRE